jgi:hypothetical protein
MNLFYLDSNIEICAQVHCDQHVRKMVIEYSQMLANCFTPEQLAHPLCPRTQKGTVRKYSHLNHPTSKWVMDSSTHFEYLVDLACLLHSQHVTRSGKTHFTSSFLFWVRDNKADGSSNLPTLPFVEPPIAIGMDQNCRKLPNFDAMSTVDKYRAYYIHDKLFATWKEPEMIPDWFRDGRNAAGIPVIPPRRTRRTT